MRRPLVLTVGLALPAFTTACASGPAISTAPVVGVTSAAAAPGLRLALGASFTQGVFSARTTCDERPDSSPALSYSSTGPGVAELAVTLVDTTDGTVYWIQTGLAAGSTHLVEHELSPSAREWPNDLAQNSYDGPCQAHAQTDVYAFTLYALPTPVDLTSSPSADASVAALLAASTAHVAVTAVYTRTGTVPPRYAPGGPYLDGT